MKVYCCPNCGGAIVHVTDDIFRCPACRWNGANVIEQRPPVWPTHADGRQKRMGELTPEEQDAQLTHICADLKKELDGPQSPFLALLKESK